MRRACSMRGEVWTGVIRQGGLPLAPLPGVMRARALEQEQWMDSTQSGKSTRIVLGDDPDLTAIGAFDAVVVG